MKFHNKKRDIILMIKLDGQMLDINMIGHNENIHKKRLPSIIVLMNCVKGQINCIIRLKILKENIPLNRQLLIIMERKII